MVAVLEEDGLGYRVVRGPRVVLVFERLEEAADHLELRVARERVAQRLGRARLEKIVGVDYVDGVGGGVGDAEIPSTGGA